MSVIKQYRDEEECRYYASDLNKFAGISCRKDMVVCNIDMLQFRYQEKELRIIESKHEHEKDSPGAEKAFEVLHHMLSTHDTEYKIGFYKIIGNAPYETSVIYDYFSDTSKKITQHELIAFLDYHKSYDDL